MRQVLRHLLAIALLVGAAAGAHAEDQTCVTIEGLRAGTTGYGFWIAPRNQRVAEAGCHCEGQCTGPRATLALSDRSGNAISLTGGGDLSCSIAAASTTYVTTDGADTDRDLVAGEGLKFSVTNTPATNDKVTLCVKLSPLP